MTATRTRGVVVVGVAGTIALAVLVVAVLGSRGERVPTDASQEQQALAIERQLLCPQCTNKRLDVCELAICNDMKRVIRERLAAGALPDEIIFAFSNTYGPRVLAELPREGFNLALFGWVGGSIVAVGLLGGWFLYRLRRPSRLDDGRASVDGDDAWIDEQLARHERAAGGPEG